MEDNARAMSQKLLDWSQRLDYRREEVSLNHGKPYSKSLFKSHMNIKTPQGSLKSRQGYSSSKRYSPGKSNALRWYYTQSSVSFSVKHNRVMGVEEFKVYDGTRGVGLIQC